MAVTDRRPITLLRGTTAAQRHGCRSAWRRRVTQDCRNGVMRGLPVAGAGPVRCDEVPRVPAPGRPRRPHRRPDPGTSSDVSCPSSAGRDRAGRSRSQPDPSVAGGQRPAPPGAVGLPVGRRHTEFGELPAGTRIELVRPADQAVPIRTGLVIRAQAPAELPHQPVHTPFRRIDGRVLRVVGQRHGVSSSVNRHRGERGRCHGTRPGARRSAGASAPAGSTIPNACGGTHPERVCHGDMAYSTGNRSLPTLDPCRIVRQTGSRSRTSSGVVRT